MEALDTALQSGDVGVLQDVITRFDRDPTYSICGKLLEAKRLLSLWMMECKSHVKALRTAVIHRDTILLIQAIQNAERSSRRHRMECDIARAKELLQKQGAGMTQVRRVLRYAQQASDIDKFSTEYDHCLALDVRNTVQSVRHSMLPQKENLPLEQSNTTQVVEGVEAATREVIMREENNGRLLLIRFLFTYVSSPSQRTDLEMSAERMQKFKAEEALVHTIAAKLEGQPDRSMNYVSPAFIESSFRTKTTKGSVYPPADMGTSSNIFKSQSAVSRQLFFVPERNDDIEFQEEAQRHFITSLFLEILYNLKVGECVYASQCRSREVQQGEKFFILLAEFQMEEVQARVALMARSQELKNLYVQHYRTRMWKTQYGETY